MKNVLKQLAKSNLIPLGLTAAASATDAANTILIIFNEEMNHIKIIKYIKESGLLLKGVNKNN